MQDELHQPVGPARVWLGDAWMPGLAMSRSIGDTIAASCGVSPCPEVSVVDLTPDDLFIILASDGVWEFLDSQDAVDTVKGCCDAPEACKALTAAAKACWEVNEPGVSDDISCVIVFLKPQRQASVSAPPAQLQHCAAVPDAAAA